MTVLGSMGLTAGIPRRQLLISGDFCFLKGFVWVNVSILWAAHPTRDKGFGRELEGVIYM